MFRLVLSVNSPMVSQSSMLSRDSALDVVNRQEVANGGVGYRSPTCRELGWLVLGEHQHGGIDLMGKELRPRGDPEVGRVAIGCRAKISHLALPPVSQGEQPSAGPRMYR